MTNPWQACKPLLSLYALLHGMHSAFVLNLNGRLPRLLHLAPRPARGRASPGRGSYRSRNRLNTARVVVTMAHTVFVYGTLLSEEIVKILLNRNPESYAGEKHSGSREVLLTHLICRPIPAATVKGYRRYRIQGRVYPAILRTLPSDVLTGMVSRASINLPHDRLALPCLTS